MASHTSSLRQRLSKIGEAHKLSASEVFHIYESYLKLIMTKAADITNLLDQQEIKDENEMYNNKCGDYCFYLRFLGKYFINYKAYKKWKLRKLKK